MTTAGALFAAAETWPVVGLETITKGRPLILAPHPDDESLGCGGLLAESCARGELPVLAVLTDGVGSHPNSRTHPPRRLKALREEETIAAAACLGLLAERVVFLRYPDTAAPKLGPAFAEAVSVVATLVRRYGCRSLITTWRHDPHCDHEAASLIGAAAAAQVGVTHRDFPVWGRTLPPDMEVGPASGVRLDVSGWRAAKRRAIRSHRSQWAGVITDDPAGFQMQPSFMALFDTPYELFLDAA
jgi:LmbE family N-acetylglucosaminyl deacetylase